jgi:hypothetical protein
VCLRLRSLRMLGCRPGKFSWLLGELNNGGGESLLLEGHKQSSCMLYPTRDGEEDRRNRGVRWQPLVGVNIT